MTKTRIFSVLTIFVLSFALATGVQAQLGKALNKAKEKAKEKVQSETKKASEGATTKARENVSLESVTTTVTQQAGKASLKPSAAAIAADPLASDNTVDEGFTRSRAHIRAAYEQLPDPQSDMADGIGFFKPYYAEEYKHFYELNDESRNIYLNEEAEVEKAAQKIRKFGRFQSRMLTMPRLKYSSYIGLKTPTKTGYVVMGSYALNAGYALFAADPAGTIPYERFVRARFIFNCFNGLFQVDAKSDDRELVMNWSYYLAFYNRENQRLEQLIHKETPYEVIRNASYKYMNALIANAKANEIFRARVAYHRFEIVWNDMINHPKHKEDENTKALTTEYKKYEELYDKWGKEANLANKQAMPKAGRLSSAALEADILSVAKRDKSFANAVKVVITSDDWVLDRNALGQIVRRRVNVYVITKDGEHYIAQSMGYQQEYDGSKYGATKYFGVGTSSFPVDYKP